MSTERWRSSTLVAVALVGCLLLLRTCRYITRANSAFTPQVIENRDPDDICWTRCLGPWSSYSRSADGEDHCTCVGRPR